MHTTASDGRLAPVELVARAAAAGLTTIAVTDHDTVAAVADTTTAAAAAGIRVIAGIEITAVDHGRDVHLLAYFFDTANERLLEMLARQRALRVSRVREIAARLASLNLPIDVGSVLLAAAARPGSSVGRPQVARELLRAGHVTSVREAFDLWLAEGRPGFVERTGPSPAAVVDTIHEAKGIASFAHPGVTRRDELIAPLVDHGLDAIEVFHPDHTPEDVVAYRGMAVRRNALVSGGSDFHGDPFDSPARPSRAGSLRAGDPAVRAYRGALGVIGLPPADFEALEAKAAVSR